VGSGILKGFASGLEDHHKSSFMPLTTNAADEKSTSIIGQYGSWAASLIEGKLPRFLSEIKNGQVLKAGGHPLKKELPNDWPFRISGECLKY